MIEMTLRTPDALDAIRSIVEEVPEAIVGAGSIRNVRQMELAIKAGASFLVSPGASDDLLRSASRSAVQLLPGVATATEAMRAADEGYRRLKFFPAEAAGGVATLNAWRGPLHDLLFCPTGGISQRSAPSYLGCPNVICVGGSWLTPGDAVTGERWSEITSLARESLVLPRR